jgi:6-phosphogluconolactonase
MINLGWWWRWSTDRRVAAGSRGWCLVTLALIAAVAEACGPGVFPEVSPSATPTATPTAAPSATPTPGSGAAAASRVYVTNFADGRVSVLTNSSGTLSAPATIAAGAASGPVGLTLATPSGAAAPLALYVANPADNTIHEFGVSSSGSLRTLATIAAGSQPQHVVVDPTGDFAWAINSGGSISQYLINAQSGELSANSAVAITEGLVAPVSGVASGSFLYVTDPSNGAGLALTYSASSGLLSLASTVATGGADPGPIAAFSVTGGSTWVAVADATTGVVSLFQVQGSKLSLSGTVGTGSGAAGLVFAQTSSGLTFLYVANPSADSVTSFSFNTTTGVLALLAVTPGLRGPTGLAVDNPSAATTLFAVNNTNGTVSTFSLDPTTGQLTAINSFATESPANSASAPEFVVVL